MDNHMPTQARHISVSDVPHEAVPCFVTVNDSTPEGGYGRLFGRVVDWGFWGLMEPAEKDVYVPLCRRASPLNGFRVTISQEELVKLTGASISKIKRGVQMLVDRGLLLIESAGGSGTGGRAVATYRLTLPSVKPMLTPSVGERGSQPNPDKPPNNHPFTGEPRPPVNGEPPSPVDGEPRSPVTPSKGTERKETSSYVVSAADAAAVELLTERGFDLADALEQVRKRGPAQAVTAVAIVDWRKGRGKPVHSVRGLIVTAIEKCWTLPAELVKETNDEVAKAGHAVQAHVERTVETDVRAKIDEERRRREWVVASLDDEQLASIKAKAMEFQPDCMKSLLIRSKIPVRENAQWGRVIVEYLERNNLLPEIPEPAPTGS